MRLAARAVSLAGIMVTAQERTDEQGTSSVVGGDAIEHEQPASLADGLQLVPGQIALNPTLGDARQLLLRQLPVLPDAGGLARDAAR